MILRGMDLTNETYISTTKLHHRTIVSFHTTSNEDDLYIKIVAFDKIYKFLVLSLFSFEIVKMLKTKI